jgi:steroid delta-isomerase-like uncharacterized protein
MPTLEAARGTMTAYLDTLLDRGPFARYFAEDVSLFIVGTEQEAHGAVAVEAAIRHLHEQAFDARPEFKSLIVDGERAALEADFVGRHKGEFFGKSATGKHVRVPYSVVYDLEGDRVKTLRIYMSMDGLLRQVESGSPPGADVLVRRYYEVCANAYSPDAAAAAMSEILSHDFVFHPPNNVAGHPGLERHRQWLVWHHDVLADQQFALEDVVVTGSRGATRWVLSGVHHAEFLGIPANGNRVAITGQDFFRLENGRVAELWRSFDIREIARQLAGQAG